MNYNQYQKLKALREMEIVEHVQERGKMGRLIPLATALHQEA